jgi:hypothetical protein
MKIELTEDEARELFELLRRIADKPDVLPYCPPIQIEPYNPAPEPQPYTAPYPY